MRKTLPFCVLAVLMLATGTVRAQDVYHPITDGCTWSVSNEKYMTAGDTVLDGKTYLKLYRQVGSQPFEFNLEDAEFFAAIRDDSTERKVYAYLPAGTWVLDYLYGNNVTSTGMEVVLYDFSLQLEDNITYYTIHPTSHVARASHAYRADNAYMIVGDDNGQSQQIVYMDSDSLIIMSDGSIRHRIFICSDISGEDEVWIEGIGRLRGFDDCHITGVDNPSKILLCYEDKLGTSYQTGFEFDGTDDCFSSGFGGDVPEMNLSPIQFYPNPVWDFLSVRSKRIGTNSRIEIVSETGRCLISETMADGFAVVDLRALSPGLYFVKVFSDNQKTVHKIIKL